MGLSGLLDLVFGERNGLRETLEVFRPNAEAGARRDLSRAEAALSQFADEFDLAQRGRFDRVIDGLNRLPRPAMAFGAMALFVSAMVDPVWFSERMQGVALVPEPLWWLLGAVVSFYFGARHQAKTQEFQRSIARTLARTPEVAEGLGRLRALRAPDDAADAVEAADGAAAAPNPALAEWRRSHDGA